MQLLKQNELPVLNNTNSTKFIELPQNWWASNNSYTPNFTNNDLKIIDFPKEEIIPERKIKKLKAPKDWNTKFGDHRVKEAYKDMSFYIEFKKRLLQNSIYPAILLGAAVVYYFSKIAAGF